MTSAVCADSRSVGKRTRNALLPLAGAAVLAQTVAAVAADSAQQPTVAAATADLIYRLPIVGIAKDGQNPATQTSFVTSATAARDGDEVDVTARVRSEVNITVVVDVEIYAPSGARVNQQYQDNTVFHAGEEQQFHFEWTPPAGAAKGTYTVVVGLFEPGREWQTLYHWNVNAGSFVLE
jgi:hypothetical protein